MIDVPAQLPNLNTIEFFSGRESFSKAMRLHGHNTFTIDYNHSHKPDLVANVFDYFTEIKPQLSKSYNVAWFGVDCTCFSKASMWKHWKKLKPKTQKAIEAIQLVKLILKIIEDLQPDLWFIENPVGKLRMLELIPVQYRKTVTYCCYNDNRMKPTDIWTNCKTWNPKLDCSSQKRKCITTSSTNELTTAIQRSQMPVDLCREIVEAIEWYYLKKSHSHLPNVLNWFYKEWPTNYNHYHPEFLHQYFNFMTK